MTCEDLLEWVESKLGDFDSYEDIEDFEKELLNVTDQGSQENPRVIENVKDKLKDWFDGNLNVSGYDSNEAKGNILGNQVGKATSLEDLDAIDTGLVSGPEKTKLQGAIDNKRNELIPAIAGPEIQSIKDQISSAKSQDDIGDITVGPIQREYGKGVADEIRTLLAEKGNEMKSVEEEFREALEARIGGATTLAQLETIESRIADAPTTPLEEDLLRQLGSKRGQIGQ